MIDWIVSSEINNGTLLLILISIVTMVVVSVFHFQNKHQKLQHQIEIAQNEIRAINSGNLGMGRKINQFANEIANVEIKQMVEQGVNVSDRTYSQAGLLLERGATIEEVADSCGMSPSEVELLAILKHSGAAA